MFRAVCRPSSGAPTVFAASGLHMHAVTARIRAVTACVCKAEAANTVGAPDDERHTARNMLSL